MTASRTRLQGLRTLTLRYVNPLTRLVAGWLPGFGLLLYRGRKSGTEYRTPMNVFRRGDEYVFALTYGRDVQWVKNVVAAGGCQMVTRGRTIRLTGPRLFHDPSRSTMPPVIREFLGVMRVTEFLEMRVSPTLTDRP